MTVAQNDWYAARVRAGRETQALDWLERKAIEGRVLWSYVLQKHNRSKKLTWRARRLAPGYVFVQLPAIEVSSLVRQCEDIVCFVGARHRPPLSLRMGEMGTMLGLEAAEEFEREVPPAPSFSVGDEVLVLNGLAAEQKGLIVKLFGKREASVLLDQLSKDRPFRIAIDMLEKAG